MLLYIKIDVPGVIAVALENETGGITRKAVEIILERSGFYERKIEGEISDSGINRTG
jgi:hypothetical protein